MVTQDGSWLVRFREPGLTVLVVVEFLLLFGVAPFANERAAGPAQFAFSILIVASAVIVVSHRPAATTAILLTAAGNLAVRLLAPQPPSPFVLCLVITGNIAFLIVLTWVIGTAVFGPGRVTAHRIQGAVAIYLQTGLIFAQCYLVILTLVPGAFSVPALPNTFQNLRRFLYFSFVTLTSTGYGDIAPVLPFARSLANVEAIIGQLFPATLLARLVTLEVEGRRR